MLRSTSLVLAITTVLSSTSLADDLIPFPLRGAPGSVFAEWDFESDVTDPTAYSFVPLPGADIAPLPPAFIPAGLFYTIGDGDGGWIGGPGGGIAGFLLPNFIDFEPVKAIQIQLTFQTDLSGAPFVASILGTDNVVGEVFGAPIAVEDFDGFRIETWTIQPNPDYESFQIFVPERTVLDQVVIDTISIPEVSSMGMCAVALAGLTAVGRWRSRR